LFRREIFLRLEIARPVHFFFANSFCARMKAKIVITPKKAVVDPQGITVLKALEHLGHTGIKAVHVGKYIEIELDGTDKETVRIALDEAVRKLEIE
jgi:phosphoribosylformylglycinamidine synthase